MLNIYMLFHFNSYDNLLWVQHIICFVDEETDGQRDKGAPSNSEVVELGYHRSHFDAKIPGPTGLRKA